jgi:DNA gyrase/topoisomerase IV subunit B
MSRRKTKEQKEVEQAIARANDEPAEQPKLKQATDLEHMRNQTGMYLGGKAVITSREYRVDPTLNRKDKFAEDAVRLIPTRLSPAAVKIMDEIVVNAVDQYTRFGADIYFTWDDDGTITVVNTKSSFKIYEVETTDGRKMLSIQMAFGEFKTSTNFDLSQESITGGMNGIGSKGVNSFSAEFEVEVYDPETDQLICIRWTECMSRVEIIELTKDPKEKVPFVRVTFRPNYVDFGMATSVDAQPDADILEQYRQLFYQRVQHTAAFCQGSRVFWNDELVQVTPATLVRQHILPHFADTADARTMQIDIAPARGLKNRKLFVHGGDLRWQVVLAVKDNKEALEQFSIVNGILVKEGTHLDMLRDQIVDYCRPLWIELKDPSKKASKAKKQQGTLAELQTELEQVEKQKKDAAAAKKTALSAEDKAKATLRHKAFVAREKALKVQVTELKEREASQPKFDRRVIEKYLFIAMSGYINRPSFTGQRKDKLDSPQEQFSQYKIPESRLQDFWDMLRPLIEFDIFKGATKGKTGSGTKKIKCPHHKPAAYYATKNRAQAVLISCEGDSAAGTIDKMRGVKGSKINHQTHGLFILGGVTMNIQREITFRTNPKTGERVAILSDRFKENERMQEFFQVLNLDPNKSYKTQEERDTLTYGGGLDIGTDQDEDGKGNIRSGQGNLFLTLWPDLIRCGYVRFVRTPIVRAYHRAAKETAQEFFTEGDYRAWEKRLTDAVGDAALKKWEVVYYKGLGSHGEEETINMARKYDRLLVTFTMDKRSDAACRVYFSEDADLRKMVLVDPPRHTEDYYYRQERINGVMGTTVSITNHFNTETKSYQIYNIARHILHRIDGRLPSRRKVLAGTRKMLGHKNSRVKVFQLSGDIARKMGYHHGDASLNGNVMGETQDFPGAREFPFLLAISNSGSRKMGGTDAAAPRYAFTKYNQRLGDAVFPQADDYILDYVFDDGMRCEPTFYIPVVPMAILENYRSPGHGWSCTVWARCFWEVLAWTRECVEKGWRRRETEFGVTRHRFQDEIVTIKGVENSVGRYKRRGDVIEITEMPRCMWNEHFLNGNPKDKKSKGISDEDWVVEPPLDISTDTEISIEIRCREGFLDSLPPTKDKYDDGRTQDPIIKLLDLKQSLAANLNFIDVPAGGAGGMGAVVECGSYVDVFDGWFKVRLDAYERRMERMRILLRLRIEMAEVQLRFIKKREALGLAKKKVAEQNRIIESAGFPRMDKPLLDQPSFTRIEVLESEVRGGEGASWDYLRKMDADDLSEEGEESLRSRIQKLQHELAEYNEEGALKKTWLRELDHLEAIVRQGHELGWTSWEPRKKFAEDEE